MDDIYEDQQSSPEILRNTSATYDMIESPVLSRCFGGFSLTPRLSPKKCQQDMVQEDLSDGESSEGTSTELTPLCENVNVLEPIKPVKHGLKHDLKSVHARKRLKLENESNSKLPPCTCKNCQKLLQMRSNNLEKPCPLIVVSHEVTPETSEASSGELSPSQKYSGSHYDEQSQNKSTPSFHIHEDSTCEDSDENSLKLRLSPTSLASSPESLPRPQMDNESPLRDSQITNPDSPLGAAYKLSQVSGISPLSQSPTPSILPCLKMEHYAKVKQVKAQLFQLGNPKTPEKQVFTSTPIAVNADFNDLISPIDKDVEREFGERKQSRFLDSEEFTTASESEEHFLMRNLQDSENFLATGECYQISSSLPCRPKPSIGEFMRN